MSASKQLFKSQIYDSREANTPKSKKKVKKIRKTNDLICFDVSHKYEEKENMFEYKPSCEAENNSPLLKKHSRNLKPHTTLTNSQKKKDFTTSFRCGSRSASIQGPDGNTFVEQIENCKMEEKNSGVDNENPKVINHSIPSNDLTNNSKRKIIKAKRLLKINCTVPDQLEKKTEFFMKPRDDFIEEGIKSSHSEQMIESNTVSTSVVAKVPLHKRTNNFDLTVTTLLSPISPSENSTSELFNRSPQTEHLHFNSSKEDVYPSTHGTAETSSRRRTYELEDSTIDPSLLKSASETDSVRINSFPSDKDSTECKTPQEIFSKVTIRRKWQKTVQSPQVDYSPSWINTILKSSNKKVEKSFTPLESEKDHIEMEKGLRQTSTLKKSSKKVASKVKIPNFAAIHQRALNKVENIADYKERKEKRARMLLSGKKPEPEPEPLTKNECRKQLRFAPDTSSKEKSPTFIPLPSTPLPKRVIKESPVTRSPVKFVETKFTQFAREQGNKFKFTSMKNSGKKVFAHDLKITKPVQPTAHFKITKLDRLHKNEVKSIITKSKTLQNTVESRRCAIKGVRSNRRFELLMNMRKGK